MLRSATKTVLSQILFIDEEIRPDRGPYVVRVETALRVLCAVARSVHKAYCRDLKYPLR